LVWWWTHWTICIIILASLTPSLSLTHSYYKQKRFGDCALCCPIDAWWQYLLIPVILLLSLYIQYLILVYRIYSIVKGVITSSFLVWQICALPTMLSYSNIYWWCHTLYIYSYSSLSVHHQLAYSGISFILYLNAYI
jgi:hypothetical protein